ncbi:hypothetical protein, partial [Pseudomonas sp. L1(2025)]|uniref:hypothetical protein n=1 Tax=Pseudomonas sp. L1(2025) TaxID=3449429 RepID=UPI003F68CC5D
LFDDEVSGLLICAFDLDLKSPRQTRWPESDRDLGAKPAGMPVPQQRICTPPKAAIAGKPAPTSRSRHTR